MDTNRSKPSQNPERVLARDTSRVRVPQKRQSDTSDSLQAASGGGKMLKQDFESETPCTSYGKKHARKKYRFTRRSQDNMQQPLDGEQWRQNTEKQQRGKQHATDLKVEQGRQNLQRVERQVHGLDSRLTVAEEKLKKELRKMYNRSTVLVQDTVNAECCSEVPLDEMFVELRLQKSATTKLPESLSYRDVEEMQRSMQSSKPIETSQLFDKLHDRCAPRKILMLGKAGIGKTTLIKQIASQWAKKELWKHVEYLFVITLRQLRQDRKLTLGELLLDGLSLTKEEKTAALNHLRENASTVMIIAEGWDEIAYTGEEDIERDDTKAVDLNMILSSILNNVMLPGAKVLITSRPNDNIPVCDRSFELYGFTQANIDMYIHKFSGQDTELEQFIRRYLQSNVNIATMCYVPVHTNFVCACLKDMRSSSRIDDTPTVNTMTHLYIFAVINLTRKLHPSLKGSKTGIDERTFLAMVGDSLKRHAELAKYCTLSTPQRIIMYEGDLDRFHISDKDKHTGFLAQSMTRSSIQGLKRRCWFFHHLTMQEMFAAVGLLRGPHEALLELIENETSVCQHEVLIRFVVGLLCDRHSAHFMDLLESAKDQLDPRTVIEKLARVFDPLQLITAIYESQCPDLTDLVPREIESNNVFPTEMMALSWVLIQHECHVISLNLSRSSLDIHLVRQLCDGLRKNTSLKLLNLSNCYLGADATKELSVVLAENRSIQSLNLSYCDLDAGAMMELSVGLATNTSIQSLDLSYCDLDAGATKELSVGLATNTSIQSLDLSCCDLDADAMKELSIGLAANTSIQSLNLSCCDLDADATKELSIGLAANTSIQSLNLSGNKVFASVKAGRSLGAALAATSTLRQLDLDGCGLISKSFEHIADGLRAGCPMLMHFKCADNSIKDDVEMMLRDLMTQLPQLRMSLWNSGVSAKCFYRLNEKFGDRSSMHTEKVAPTFKTPCKWDRLPRMNKDHTEKLSWLFELQEKQPDKLVQDLQQICLCTEDKFRIGKGSVVLGCPQSVGKWKFGTEVYIGLIRDGRETAVKKVMHSFYKLVKAEVKTLVKLRHHPNIVDYMMVDKDKDKYSYIATELCDFTVEQWLEQTEVKELPEKDRSKKVTHLVKGLLRGLDYMHTSKPCKILHRDIKPQNVFVVSAKGEECIKIADFDLSHAFDPDMSTMEITGTGTLLWMPKELLEQIYAEKTPIQYKTYGDIQSAGMVCFYMMSGGIHPYAPDGRLDKAQTRIMDGDYNLSAVDDPVACDLVKHMLAPEPREQPSAGELLRHPYFWYDKKRCDFLASTGNLCEVEKSHIRPRMHLTQEIDDMDDEVFPNHNDWIFLCDKMKMFLDGQYETDKTCLKRFNDPLYVASMCKLLRTIRNFTQHTQFSPEAESEIGTPDKLYCFVNSALPKLFITTYKLIKSSAGKVPDHTKQQELKEYFWSPTHSE